VTSVKICGITQTAHALAAADAGADFIGLVFAPSKRLVDVEQAKEIVAAVERHGERKVLTVGVFVNAPAAEVNSIAEYCGLDRVQLSGDEPWDYLRDIERPVIKAVRVRRGQSSQDILAELAPGYQMLGVDFMCLLDCYASGSYGGSGKAFDWRVAREAAQRFTVIMAGGLSAQNVGEAVRLIRPWGVDVSSGVESEGVKDILRIKAFIEAVRKADRVLVEN
jgi:phosphoribosylanthranilate isomerase